MIQINSELPAQIVILAGGLGTRIRPLTNTIPKAMIPIHGKPFIHYQLDWLARCGIQNIILSIGYLGESIEEYVQDGKQWGLKVQYTHEGSQLQGTAGALRLCLEKNYLQEKFLLTYGDSFLPIDYQSVWKSFISQKEPALMTVLKNSEKWDKSNVCFNGKSVTLYDKKNPNKPDDMVFIDYGLSALSKNLIQTQIPKEGPADLSDLFHILSKSGLLSGYEVTQRFYEIGSMSGIQDLEEALTRPESFR